MKTRNLKIVHSALMVGLTLCVAGCGAFLPWTHLRSGEYKDNRRGFSAVIPADWMRYNMAKNFVMTRDGITLNRVVVEKGRIDAELEYTKKKFSKDMLPQDLAELEIDNMRADANRQFIEVLENRPVKVSGQPAFRLEYTYQTPQGLKYHARQYGFLYNDRIYRILYEAADQHYYRAYLKDFERFMETFCLTEPPKTVRRDNIE